jgi:hypothetical protein
MLYRLQTSLRNVQLGCHLVYYLLSNNVRSTVKSIVTWYYYSIEYESLGAFPTLIAVEMHGIGDVVHGRALASEERECT